MTQASSVVGRWRAYGPWTSQPRLDGDAVRAEGLSVQYDATGARALDGVDLVLRRGECVALLGDNGAGKSTLLKAIAGLVAPTAGSLRVFELPVGWCRAAVGYLPQRGELDWDYPIDVRSLVGAGRQVHLGWWGRLGRRDREIVDAAIDRLALRDIAAKQIGRLSGGQQQRALVARTLVQEAELVLLDEPTSSMDADSARTVVAALAELVAAGRTVVMSTHDPELLEDIAGRVIRLDRGRIVEDRRPSAR